MRVFVCVCLHLPTYVTIALVMYFDAILAVYHLQIHAYAIYRVFWFVWDNFLG
jgi:hypothetical protein